MPRKTQPLVPPTEELVRQLGERLRLARLRRHLTGRQVAERAGMAPMTLRSLERGSPAVTMGAYAAVMQVLGMEKDLDLVAQADLTGRSLQDALLSRRRSTGINRKRPAPASATRSHRDPAASPRRSVSAVPSSLVDETQGKALAGQVAQAAEPYRRTLRGFTNTQDLVRLLEVDAVTPSREGHGE